MIKSKTEILISYIDFIFQLNYVADLSSQLKYFFVVILTDGNILLNNSLTCIVQFLRWWIGLERFRVVIAGHPPELYTVKTFSVNLKINWSLKIF